MNNDLLFNLNLTLFKIVIALDSFEHKYSMWLFQSNLLSIIYIYKYISSHNN